MELNIYAINSTGANKAFSGYNFANREEALSFMFGLQIGLRKTHKTVALIAFCCGNLFHTIDVGQRFPLVIHQSEADFLAQLPKKDL